MRGAPRSTAEPATPPARDASPAGGWGLAVALLAFAAFAPALLQGFVLGDDESNLAFNDRWRGLSPAHLRWMWTTGHLGHYQPLSWMSFALEHAVVGGVSPRSMHAVNMALHAGTAALFFLLLVRLLRAGFPELRPAEERRARLAAAGGALLYAVHPLRVESVAWATERRDVLAGLFLVATTLAWLRHLEGRGRLVWVLALYAASLLSKAWGITLPVVLVVLDLHPLRRWDGTARGLWRRIVEKWPFVPLALAGAAAAALAQSGDSATVPLAWHGVIARCVQAAYGLGFYLRVTLWPADLSTLYLLHLPLDPWRARYAASVAGVLLLTLALWLLRKRFPALLAAWVAYGVLVSPVLGFLQSGLQEVADRYTYLAALPLSALAAAGLLALLRRERLAPGAIAAGAAVLAVLFVATWRQTRVWRDSVTLWSRAVAVEPDNPIARYNLAVALRREGDVEGALEHARRSVALEGGAVNAFARVYLGSLHAERGEIDEAVAAWRETLAVDPGNVLALEGLVRELSQRGRAAELEAILREVLGRRPELLGVRDALARLLLARGDPAGAAGVWQESVRADPRWVPALAGLGRILLEQGRGAEAEALLARAVDVDPGNPPSLVGLGRLRAAQRRPGEAEALWRRALAADPGCEEAQRLLERLQERGGR